MQSYTFKMNYLLLLTYLSAFIANKNVNKKKRLLIPKKNLYILCIESANSSNLRCLEIK